MYYRTQDGVIDDLKKYIPDYSKNQEWLSSAKLYSKLKPYFDNAMNGAENLNKRMAESGNPKASSCNVNKLFEDLQRQYVRS